MTRSYDHSILWLVLFFFFEDLSHHFPNSHVSLFSPPMCGHPSECSYRGVCGIEGATRKASVVRNHGCRVTGAMGPPSVEEREVGTRKSPVATGGHSSYQLLEVPEDESREEMPDSSPVPICRDLLVR